METYAVWGKAKVAAHYNQVIGHVRVAAEFAAQRPVSGSGTFYKHAHVDAALRSELSDVLQVLFAVGGKHAHAFLVKISDVYRFLYRIAVRNSVWRNSQRKNLVQLIAGSNVKVGPQLSEHRYYLVAGIGLYRVINLGKRK